MNTNKSVFLGKFEVRSMGDDGVVEGRAIVFDSTTDMGWYNERIDVHALDNTDMRDVRFCLNHDTEYVYARSRNNNENSTMQLSVRDDGLWIRANLDIANSPQAQSLYSAIKRNDIDQMSFMFNVDADTWADIDTDHPTRTINSISKIYEVSAVTFPAYTDTSISARSIDGVLDSAKSSLESVKAEKRAIELQKLKVKILSEV